VASERFKSPVRPSNRTPIGSLKQGRAYLVAGVAIFASALVYYVAFRSQLPWPGYLLNLQWARLSQLTDYTHGTYPSFAFALSMGLVAIGLFVTKRAWVVSTILGIWAVGLIHEVFLSTFTVADVLAGTLGAVIAMHFGLLATRLSSHRLSTQIARLNSTLNDRIKFSLLMLSSILFATGTSPYEENAFDDCLEYDVNGTCVSTAIDGTPVYMSYAELRSAVKRTDPRALETINRIYLYENYLFANERNQGIHIIDNTFPTSPKRIGFIEIPGNQEIEIKKNAANQISLYADSYIDLVTIDITDIQNISEIARLEDVFPYDSRQNIPDNVRLSGTVDRDLGVVVGYQ